MTVFTSLNEALKQGFQIYDRTSGGYVVRRKGRDNLWEMALVELHKPPVYTLPELRGGDDQC